MSGTHFASVTVPCLVHNTSHKIHPKSTRVVYWPQGGDRSFVLYLCPGCNDAHRTHPALEVLDELRRVGAPSDWPQTPGDYASFLAALQPDADGA